jgi:hypothetical protein
MVENILEKFYNRSNFTFHLSSSFSGTLTCQHNAFGLVFIPRSKDTKWKLSRHKVVLSVICDRFL